MHAAEFWNVCDWNSLGFWLLSFFGLSFWFFVVFCHVPVSHNFEIEGGIER
jgi:hypothetical protein